MISMVQLYAMNLKGVASALAEVSNLVRAVKVTHTDPRSPEGNGADAWRWGFTVEIGLELRPEEW